MLKLLRDEKKGSVTLSDGALVLARGELGKGAYAATEVAALIKAVANLGCELVSARCSAIRGQEQARFMGEFLNKLLARLNPPMGKAAKVKLIKGAYAGFGEGLARKAVKR